MCGVVHSLWHDTMQISSSSQSQEIEVFVLHWHKHKLSTTIVVFNDSIDKQYDIPAPVVLQSPIITSVA